MDQAQPAPVPTPRPTLADILRMPSLTTELDIDEFVQTLPAALGNEVKELVEQATFKVTSLSPHVRVERAIADSLDRGLWITKIEPRDAPSLQETTFADDDVDLATREIRSRYHEFELTFTAVAESETLRELKPLNHHICYDLGRIVGAVLARNSGAWPSVLEWIKRAEQADFIKVETETGGETGLTIGTSALLPFFRGVAQELPAQLKNAPAHIPKFIEGLTELSKVKPVAYSASTIIPEAAQGALRAIATLEPSLFDTQISAVLASPKRATLLASAETPRRRIELIQTIVETRFGLPIGAFRWEEMPVSRGAVIGAVEELRQGLKTELRTAYADREEFPSESAPSFTLGEAIGAFSDASEARWLFDFFQRQQILERVHAFRCIGVPADDIKGALLPLLWDENSLLGKTEYRQAVIAEDWEAVATHFESLNINPLHAIDREFLEPLICTLLERGEKITDAAILKELELHAQHGGEFANVALDLLALGDQARAYAVNAQFIQAANNLPAPDDLPALLVRYDLLTRITQTDNPQALLSATLPVVERLDGTFKQNDPANHLVAVDPAFSRPGIWAERLRGDEAAGLKNLLENAVRGADEPPPARIAAAGRMLTQGLAIRTIRQVAKLLPHAELQILFKAVWPRLDEDGKEAFICHLTNRGHQVDWLPTPRSAVVLEEAGKEKGSAVFDGRLTKLRAAYATWTVQQYYN